MKSVCTLLIFICLIGLFIYFKRTPNIDKRQEMIVERSYVRVLHNILNHTNNNDNCSLWPSKQECDIHSFSNSTAFFKNLAISEYSNYYNMKDLNEVFFDADGICRWTLLIDVTDKLADDIPVIISSTIDIKKLISFMTFSGKNPDPDFGMGVIQQNSFKRFGTILIRSEFAKSYVKGNHNPLKKGDLINWPSELYYLTPAGIAKVEVAEKTSGLSSTIQN